MKRSAQRILTTHGGSLPRPDDLVEIYRAKRSSGNYDDAVLHARTRSAVAEVVERQRELGVDVLNDGEYGKEGWQTYVIERLSGFTPQTDGTGQVWPERSDRDRLEFPGYYAEYDNVFSFSRKDNWGRPTVYNVPLACTGPITYTGHAAVQRDIDNLRAALQDRDTIEAFLPALTPIRQEQNLYYSSEDDLMHAQADAMHEEYKAIADAGFVVQVDDPGLPAEWVSQMPAPTVADYRKQVERRVEILNHALRGIPEDRIRYHICWGSWHGPHAHDLPLKDVVDLVLKVRAQGYSIEAANARHEHEWKVWHETKLPEGKVLIPGVVSHATNVIEHPELVADRILRFASVVGRENVIAGTDCGLGGRVHPELVWAKLRVLAEGAALATKQLWRR